mgnify:FL=1
MSDIRHVTPTFAVAGQLDPADFARLAAEGFTLAIKNRPEREDPGQPSDEIMREAARAAGLAFHTLAFVGPPPPGVVAETADLLEGATGPVIAYCRTGRRSIMAWAMAQALAGVRQPDEIIMLAARAGYDLEGARDALTTLAPKP